MSTGTPDISLCRYLAVGLVKRVVSSGEDEEVSYKCIISKPPIDGGGWDNPSQYRGESGLESNEKGVSLRQKLTGSTITITKDGNIILTADKDKISTRGEGEEKSAHLTARIVDAGGDTVNLMVNYFGNASLDIQLNGKPYKVYKL